MHGFIEELSPNRGEFEVDPFGYAVMPSYKLGYLHAAVEEWAGFSPMLEPANLKAPVLWLCHAYALSEAARCLIGNEPKFLSMPLLVRGICDRQYISVALMLIGYSLETCLKGFAIFKYGAQNYSENEKKYRTHDLVRLAEVLPDLNEEDKVLLKVLTSFTVWAGRYPDPGNGNFARLRLIFELSKLHEITAGEIFELANKIMSASKKLVEESEANET